MVDQSHDVPAAQGGTRSRIGWYDVARGASIMLVVSFHATIQWDASFGVNRWLWEINNLFAPIRMPVFFCVSGLLAQRLISGPWVTVTQKRVLLLWWLYALWTFIYAFVGDGLTADTLSGWAMAIAWPDEILWFIWALSFYAIIARVVPLRARPLVLALSFGLATAVSSKLVYVTNIPHFKSLIYLPFYLVGAWFPKIVTILSVRPLVGALVSVPLFGGMFLALRWNALPSIFFPVLACFGMAVSISGARLLATSQTATRAIGYFGRNTLPIYLGHALFISLFIAVIELMFTGVPSSASFWTVPLISALAIALSLALARVLKAVGLRWFYKLPSRVRLSGARNADRGPAGSSVAQKADATV